MLNRTHPGADNDTAQRIQAKEFEFPLLTGDAEQNDGLAPCAKAANNCQKLLTKQPV
jgi:hypothetical protein